MGHKKTLDFGGNPDHFTLEVGLQPTFHATFIKTVLQNLRLDEGRVISGNAWYSFQFV